MLTDEPRVTEAIGEYASRYLGGEKPELSKVYHLQKDWISTSIPNATSAGCYFFYDEAGLLLYIGKASLLSNLGKRIDSYFRWTGSELNAIHDGWIRPPFYLQTVAVSQPWEAPSLEEFLIYTLKPCSNTHGMR